MKEAQRSPCIGAGLRESTVLSGDGSESAGCGRIAQSLDCRETGNRGLGSAYLELCCCGSILYIQVRRRASLSKPIKTTKETESRVMDKNQFLLGRNAGSFV